MLNPWDHTEQWARMKEIERLNKWHPWKRKKISKTLRVRVFAEKGRDCAYCGAKDSDMLDHKLPVSLGGETSFENLFPSCHPCNSSKFNKHPDKWGADRHA